MCRRKCREALRLVGDVADEAGFPVYLVGGIVRDLFLRVTNLDIDIVVEGDGIIFAGMLVKKAGGRMKAHQKFGTAVVVLPNGLKLDIATARLEYYESPAALPTVELSSIKKDLYRRDFTINTLAVRLNRKRYGELIDFFGGLRDIKEKTTPRAAQPLVRGRPHARAPGHPVRAAVRFQTQQTYPEPDQERREHEALQPADRRADVSRNSSCCSRRPSR